MDPYDDIIELPHHSSERHPRMSAMNRAAQFSPFAALTGYECELKEAARLTHQKVELGEDQRAALDERLQLLILALPHPPEAAFTFFLPDMRKEGGTYVTRTGRLKRVDALRRTLLLTDGTEIPVDDVVDIQAERLDAGQEL